MEPMFYIGLDVHKLKISYCLKDSGGKLCAEGWLPATRHDLDYWMKNLPRPWSAISVRDNPQRFSCCGPKSKQDGR
jgi:hypothetical protein